MVCLSICQLPISLSICGSFYIQNVQCKKGENTVFPMDNRDYKPITKAKNSKDAITITNLCSILDNHSTTEIYRQHAICLKSI